LDNERIIEEKKNNNNRLRRKKMGNNINIFNTGSNFN